MKTIVSIFIGFAFVMLIFISMQTKKIRINQTIIINELNERRVSDSLIINHFLYQDSLYRDHLGECSFISRKEVKFDKNGYAYVKDKFGWYYN